MKIIQKILTPIYWVLYFIIWIIGAFFYYIANFFGWLLHQLEGGTREE